MAIDARLKPGEAGGVESVITGLAEGLSALDGDDEYLFLTIHGRDDWIRPHLRGPARPLPIAGPSSHQVRRLRASVKAIPGVAAVNQLLRARRDSVPPNSDGTIEAAGVDVIHFAHQWGFRTAVPSIYHPHDMQHRHLPQMFPPAERARRDRWYGALAEQASAVVVASSWTREDVITQLGLPQDRVHVIPWAPPLQAVSSDAGEETDPVDLDLPEQFVLYPAQTWEHKNHEALLDAVASIRHRRGLSIPLVFTGRRTEHALVLDERIRALQLESQVTWLGYVEANVLAATLRRARAVVIPSLFEAASAPLWEAFAAGVPASCSNVTSLPRQAGDAALVFDPHRIDDVADAVLRLWEDEQLRQRLVSRGRNQVSRFTWDRTARHFRALYRSVAGQVLSDEDRMLLDAPPQL